MNQRFSIFSGKKNVVKTYIDDPRHVSISDVFQKQISLVVEMDRSLRVPSKEDREDRKYILVQRFSNIDIPFRKSKSSIAQYIILLPAYYA